MTKAEQAAWLQDEIGAALIDGREVEVLGIASGGARPRNQIRMRLSGRIMITVNVENAFQASPGDDWL
jgi:hypothetical protein